MLSKHKSLSLATIKLPKPNLTKQEKIGLAQLKKDQDRVILTADKGVALVVMDKEEYISKAQELLSQLAYKGIPKDPTNKNQSTTNNHT